MSSEKANLMRLRINRVNIIQTVDAPRLVVKLVKLNVLNETEANMINSGKTREDKARNLVDCLITKEHASRDWYIKFRNVLQECSFADVAVFLDNTVLKDIHYTPKSAQQQQRQQQQVEHRPMTTSSTTTQRQFKFLDLENPLYYKETDYMDMLSQHDTNDNENELAPTSLKVFSIKPNALIASLSKSHDPDDLQQIEDEIEIYSCMMKLESLYLLYLESPTLNIKSPFLDTDITASVLKTKKLHFCMKYIKHLQEAYSIDLLKYLNDTLLKTYHLQQLDELMNAKLFKNYTSQFDLVRCLVRIFRQCEIHTFAINILTEFLNNLPTEHMNTEENTELWKLKFECASLLLFTFVDVFDFGNAYKVFNATTKVLMSIKSSLPGYKVDCTEYYYAISKLTFEEGSFQAAADWANKALLEINEDNYLITDVLIHTGASYAAKWSLLKAKLILILAIQVSKSVYGKNNPNFIKAILSYINYSNQYVKSDEQSLLLAKYALGHSKKIYGYDSITVADAYEVCCKTLIAHKIYDDDTFLKSADEAFKIASTVFLNDSPKLIKYQMTLILAFQTKGLTSEVFHEKRKWIENALDLSLILSKKIRSLYGDVNFRIAQIYMFLGTIFTNLDRNNEAENHYVRALEILEVVLPPNSIDVCLGKINLGIFYKRMGRTIECIEHLKDATKNIDSKIYGHISLIRDAYEILMDYYRSLYNLEMASLYEDLLNPDQDENEIKLKDINMTQLINSSPPKDLKMYISGILDR